MLQYLNIIYYLHYLGVYVSHLNPQIVSDVYTLPVQGSCKFNLMQRGKTNYI